MDDEMLTDILAAAILKSACAQAQCRVSAECHKWYLYVVHLDDHAHTCPACNWVTDEGGVGYPRRFMTVASLYERERSALVNDLSRWLSHLHQDAGSSGIGGSSAPLDRDASTSSPDRGAIAACVDTHAVAVDGHPVGSSPRD